MPTAKQCRFNVLIPATKSPQSPRFWVRLRINVVHICFIKYMSISTNRQKVF